MTSRPALDPYDPESYPPEALFTAQMWAHEDGFTHQWRLIAEHVAAGGEITTAPYPQLDRFDPRFPRSAVQGIQQARRDAVDMHLADAYDGLGIVETLRAEDEGVRQLSEARALVDGGDFEPPADLTSSRLHTTVTRVFTDDVVHDVAGFAYEPMHLESKQVHFSGQVYLLGYRELDLGIALYGDHQVDVVNADSTCPGSGALAIRLLWGDATTIAGAVEAGRVSGENRWVGIGHDGASRLIVEQRHRIVYGNDRLTVMPDDQFGESVWFWSAEARNGYRIYLVLDAERTPVGVILDSSGIAGYYYWDDDDEPCPGPWPESAREFWPDRDEKGNVPGVTPPTEE